MTVVMVSGAHLLTQAYGGCQVPTAMAAPHSSPSLASNGTGVAKAVQRAQAIERRQGLDPALGRSLGEHLLRERPPPPGATVAGFWPLAGEIDIRALLLALHDRGHRIVLPMTPPRGRPLDFREWHPGAVLVRGRFGTAHPDGAEWRPDVVLVPLLAFDRFGNRLGYGGGYYDRTLAALPGATTIGCAFAAQEVDAVVVEPHDVTLDAVATERGVLTFSR